MMVDTCLLFQKLRDVKSGAHLVYIVRSYLKNNKKRIKKSCKNANELKCEPLHEFLYHFCVAYMFTVRIHMCNNCLIIEGNKERKMKRKAVTLDS